MSLVIIIAAVLSLLAFMAHAFVGDKEFCQFRPADNSPEKLNNAWVQTRAGWHWVSMDLLLCSILLFLIALTDIIQSKKEILLLLSIYFAVAGLVWVTTVFFSKTSSRQFFAVGQWIFCFIQSGLIYYGFIMSA